MPGFFTKKETQSESQFGGKPLSCASCGLYRDKLHPRSGAFGGNDQGILNVGEAFGRDEDIKGQYWQGKAGKFLKRVYRELGVDLFQDTVNINAVNCRPTSPTGANREPTKFEVACCRKRVNGVIKESQPRVIILLGASALWSVISPRWKKDPGAMAQWRGWTIPVHELGAWVCPVFHPSYVIRQPDNPQVETIWKQDLQRAFGLLNTPLPEEPIEKHVQVLENPDEICGLLRGLTGWMAFDYETTGLKPHTGQQVLKCVSVAQGGRGWAFGLESPQVVGALKKTLLRANLGKVAHNMRFEQSWTLNKLRVSVHPWLWDTQLAAHILDNRAGVTGLKFQGFVNFGVSGYDDEVRPYIISTDGKGANAINKIDKLWKTRKGRHQILTYCGMDSILSDLLAEKQMREMGYES